MHEGKRPGGLTALAVINFIFGGFDALGFMGSLIVLAGIGQQPEHSQPETSPPGASASEEAPTEEEKSEKERERERQEREAERVTRLAVKLGLVNSLLAGLLIASGVGYLKQGRILGRYLGNAYAICSIGTTVLALVLLRSDLPGSGFTPLSLLALIYPLVTLGLLNTTFRHDFTE